MILNVPESLTQDRRRHDRMGRLDSSLDREQLVQIALDPIELTAGRRSLLRGTWTAGHGHTLVRLVATVLEELYCSDELVHELHHSS